jgi:hypothetical protein
MRSIRVLEATVKVAKEYEAQAGREYDEAIEATNRAEVVEKAKSDVWMAAREALSEMKRELAEAKEEAK